MSLTLTYQRLYTPKYVEELFNLPPSEVTVLIFFSSISFLSEDSISLCFLSEEITLSFYYLNPLTLKSLISLFFIPQ